MADKTGVACLRCNRTTSSALRRRRGVAKWSSAAAKFAKARLRDAGALQVSTSVAERLRVCKDCPLKTTHRGIAWCGKPILLQKEGDVGCGCPIADKARSPEEHCPLPVLNPAGDCDCKWCNA